ncbi:DUF2301 domain-containing membrane protein [Oscillatoria salina]|uniref:DUF2301 domain-containing membrane protein n=1 Tax=Oscillatoria salina TaxID=331517 RepID=UPI0013BBADAB|nr:DUF2301 domain-containing membrane protein [Oscillatoria salina]MBZ8181015.1 DUF2301 domain-containing membrane protein [Oscillatoria salina IIICB1]NET88136.1 DUF2301 domain-containing membrane protein [Kamptonema sp. SIO1D9]
MLTSQVEQVYQGQFGEFQITDRDRLGVIIYRTGLAIAAISFALGSCLLFWQPTSTIVLTTLTWLFGLFSLGLGVSLLTIHIYLIPLHRLLQLFWAIGTISAFIIELQYSQPLALFVYNHPVTLFGVGFIFASLTGIYFKEAFCFNRLETKFLTPLVPLLLLGHIVGILPVQVEQLLLANWSILFLIFALRKVIQPIPPDIGDKSVFDYLKQQRQN